MKIGDARSTVLMKIKTYSKTHDFASGKESHNMIDTILLGAPNMIIISLKNMNII